MFLSKLADIIYNPGTASENMNIRVIDAVQDAINITHEIWHGKAKDLKKYAKVRNWTVVEIRIDHDDPTTSIWYNKGKIITVI